MKKQLAILIASIFAACGLSAQESASPLFRHLDLGLTAGSTGIGFELAAPITADVRVRAGATFVPHFEKTMRFGVQVGDYTRDDYQKNYLDRYDPASGPMLSFNEWVNAESNRRFDKLSGVMGDLLGYSVDNKVDMVGSPTYNQARVIVDVTPLKNKHWHFSAGFFLGGQRIAKAYNATYDMASLMGVATYNSMYYKALAEEPLISYGDLHIYNAELNRKFINYGRMSMHVGDFTHDVYATEDILYEYTQVNGITGEIERDANGREILKGSLRYAAGEKVYSAGDPYNMVPDEDFMVKAEARVNAFRPYIGAGYSGYLDKEHRTQVSAEVGVIFWGGVPSVKTHDGVDLVHDLTNVRASIQKYLDVMKKFPVYPLVEIRIAQRLF